MKQKLDLETWNRKEHFNFFKTFTDPYYGVSVNLDCTIAFANAKKLNIPFYTYYLYNSLLAVNSVENLRYRIEEGTVFVYDKIDASATIFRNDLTFGFSHIEYDAELKIFSENVKLEIERVKNTTGLFTTENRNGVVHFSVLPWINFTSISQASNAKAMDSCPKISVGKMVEINNRKEMAFSMHVHHALVDGYHVGMFFDNYKHC